ncbi:c-type cytochrome [Ruixingdingia sedimenti]|uniref:Cytochrome c family protein n=1 Tax=Ruixingdingia sedimenti TaxID=3073604 RepID=A0ABU1F5S4_9RHOB|nr:cytochrome c family protein [Xinfangfangia sp. LG-4]MDR5652222.1 cytochrome c family protein [Xinfangfangia sp. LG-4]
MFDTMTSTKILGAVCGSLLVFLLGSWAASALYATGGGHGDHAEQAYVIDTGASEDAGGAEEEVDFDALLAAADPSKGERLFRQCAACHSVEPGKNSTGPSLAGIVGRDKGAAPGFNYSGAMAAAEGAWIPADIDHFIANPKGFVPGTTMSYAGMKKPADRADLIAYLQGIGG